jgi:hypothetical protein
LVARGVIVVNEPRRHGDDRVAGAPEARADLAHQRVVGVVWRRACRAENGHGARDVGERVEAACELGPTTACSFIVVRSIEAIGQAAIASSEPRMSSV